MKSKLFFLSLVLTFNAFSQNLPNTKIFLLPINFSPKLNFLIVSEPIEVSTVHCYNNQPTFLANGSKVDYVSNQQENKVDIYRYDLKSQKTERITNTSTYKEFSPRWAADEKSFTVIRVEPDDSTQQLWRYNSDGTPLKQLSPLNRIGYYTPFNHNCFGLFIVNKSGGALFLQDEKGKIRKIDENVGRCLLPTNNLETDSSFFYVSKKKFPDSNYHIIECNSRGKIRMVGFLPKGIEDFCIGPNKMICFVYDHKIFGMPIGDGVVHPLSEAYLITDLNDKPWGNVYRLTFYEEKPGIGCFAVVVYEGEKP